MSSGDPGERDVAYTYDADSNRKTETDNIAGWTKGYCYTSGTHELDRIEKNGVISQRFTCTDLDQQATQTTYDDAGTTETHAAFAWGDRDTLAEARRWTWDAGQGALVYEGRVAYEYDETQTLVRRRIYDASDVLLEDRRYLIDDNNPTGYSQIVVETDGRTGELIQTHTFDDRIRAQSPANSDQTYYLHADALGSIRALTGGGVAEQYDYTAFGSRLGATGSLTPYAFTGQRLDPFTGFQHHRARWLNPTVAQWVSPDSIFDFPFNFGNAYSYAGCSPLSHIDPLGTVTLGELMWSGAIHGFLWGAAYGAGMGVYEQFFTPAGGENSFWEKIIAIGARMFSQALLWAVGGAIAGPVIGAVFRLIGPLIRMAAKFAGQPLIRILQRIITSSTFRNTLRQHFGRLSQIGGERFMLFVARIAELVGARGVSVGTKVYRLTGGKLLQRAEYDILLAGRGRIAHLIECKWSRQAMRFGAELARTWARKVAEANAVGLQVHWRFYFFQKLSEKEAANLLQALKKVGVPNPTIRSGLKEIISDLVRIVH